MSKWRNLATGVVVSVDDAKDHRFDAATWQKVEAEKKPTPRRPAKKSDDK